MLRCDAAVCAGPLAELLNDGQAAPAIRVLAPAVLCVCMLSAIRGYTQGRGDMRPTAVSQIIESTGKLLVGLTAAWLLTRRAAAPNMCAAGAISGVTAGAAVSLLVLAVWLLRSHGGKKARTSRTAAGRSCVRCWRSASR